MYNLAFQKTYEDGEMIIKEGTPGDWVYFVISGKVEMSGVIAEKSIMLGNLNSGDIFGDLPFFTDANRTVIVKAIGPTTIGIIDRENLDYGLHRLSRKFRLRVFNMSRRYTELVGQFNEVLSGKEDLDLKTAY
jgi:CRP/FNR family transcriptional regulator